MQLLSAVSRSALAAGVLATGLGLGAAGAAEPYSPQHDGEGRLVRPAEPIWREWVQLGTPLTPNALNGGEAAFPEFHNVYIDPESWAHWKRTGEFREGTVIAKELVRVHQPEGAHADGSSDEVSGRGYFMGDFAGFEMAVKSKALYPDAPGNWAYYSFGHQPWPYSEAADRQPVEACSACHAASAGQDFVFTQFYPVLGAARPE